MLSADESLTKLRTIVDAWPEVVEKISHGAPTFWGGKKTFCNLQPHDDRYGGRAIWIKATHEAQAQLVDADPEHFFVPPYRGVSGWVGVRMRSSANWTMIGQLLEDGYRLVAPKRAIAKLEESRAQGR